MLLNFHDVIVSYEVSALHIAVQNGRIEVIEALTHKMDKGDLNACDNVRLLLTRYLSPLISNSHCMCDIFVCF